jgi:SAM-dependent methyltransferase
MPTALEVARRLPPLAAYLGYRALRASVVLPEFARYLLTRTRYRDLDGAERLRIVDSFPKLGDRMLTTPFDAHYLYQDSWAAQRVGEKTPPTHVDVGSRVELACFLTAICPVTFVDIRPLEAEIEGLTSLAGSVLDLPFADHSLTSLSCLHVVEHVGLGRYGDPLDPAGTDKAIRELCRVVAPGGRLLLSTPVGRPRVCFNAHRVSDPHAIRAACAELELVEFAGVDDAGTFRRHRSIDELDGQSYACGMFDLRRPA